MSGRLADKIAIIVGAGQSAGETIGNGRAMALLFAREGAQVLCADRDLESAMETASMIAEQGGSAAAFQADVSRDTAHAALFLASDEAKFISGAILPVDGGMGVRIG